MKPAVYILWFLCTVFLSGGGQAHASHCSSNYFRHVSPVKTVASFGSHTKVEFSSPLSNQMPVNTDSVLGIEDDDDEQEFIGKEAPAVRYNMSVAILCALQPLAIPSTRNGSSETFILFGTCRYLTHRALLI